MRHPRLAFAALLPLLSRAQDSTTSTSYYTTTTEYVSASSTSSSPPITTTIAVGQGGFTFTPDVVQISPGNYVEFDFYPTNHSVIRAEYEYPCIPYEMTGIDKVGFFSGFYPVDAILVNPPKWTLLINDSNPIFYYCGAPGSCIDHQMVGVINPNATVSLEVQKEDAANSSFMLTPGEPWPDEDPNPFTTTTSTATTVTTATSTSSPTPTTSLSGTSGAGTTAPDKSSHSSSLSTGAIAGIAIGSAAVVIAAAALLFFCGRRSRRRTEEGNGPTAPAMGPAHNPPAYVPPNAYGYISPAQKHLSINTMTDAFGNPPPNGGMYPGYPVTYPQGYAQVQQHPMGMMSPGHPHWPSSPSNDIFGPTAAAPPPPQMQDPLLQHQQASVPVTETHSLRATSPSSMQAEPATAPAGIEAFLARHGRMSPRQDNELAPGGAANQPNSPLLGIPHNRTSGPYEMGTGTIHSPR